VKEENQWDHHAGPSGRHSPNKYHLPVARWMEVGSGGQL